MKKFSNDWRLQTLTLSAASVSSSRLKSIILVFLVGIDGVQPLPKKVTAIEALELPKDIDELRQFLGLVSFYRKFIPFFADVTTCLNAMLRKRVTFGWMKQHSNTFKLLKSELVQMSTLQYTNPNKPFILFTDASKHSYSGILH